MNQTLIQFAEQAAEYAVLNTSEEILISESDSNKVEIPKEFITKFSELIVRECADFVDQNTLEDQGMWGKIMRHFGVEE